MDAMRLMLSLDIRGGLTKGYGQIERHVFVWVHKTLQPIHRALEVGFKFVHH